LRDFSTGQLSALEITAAHRAGRDAWGHPDVVISDIDMPVMDGPSCASDCARPCRGVSIVVVSGNVSVQGRATLGAGCDVVLKVPGAAAGDAGAAPRQAT
jgi:CheY-like chemotaxis protein